MYASNHCRNFNAASMLRSVTDSCPDMRAASFRALAKCPARHVTKAITTWVMPDRSTLTRLNDGYQLSWVVQRPAALRQPMKTS